MPTHLFPNNQTPIMKGITMFKKFLVLFVALVFASACGSESPKKEVVPAPISWNGTWSTSPDFMTATIADDVLQIDIRTKDSTSLYWKGSWPSSAVKNDVKIISQGDTAAMEASLMGSQDSTKEFTFSNKEITFKFTMMGTTKTVRLIKR